MGWDGGIGWLWSWELTGRERGGGGSRYWGWHTSASDDDATAGTLGGDDTKNQNRAQD